MAFFRKKHRIPSVPSEWLIVGLGNPGPEYRSTRHNVGFDVIDLIAAQSKIKLGERRHKALYGLGMVEGASVILAKPMTYMNLSGQSVAALSKAYGIKPDNIVVVGDEAHLPLGRLRLRAKGSSAGHNGHKSIISSLGTDEYPRLRIGIGSAEPGSQVEHVLSGFSPLEREEIDQAISASADAVRSIIREGVEITASAVNAKAPIEEV